MAILQVEDIQKRFGRTRVLEDISFSLEQGQAMAIIGSSGSGKTTPVSYTHLTLPTILRV